MSTPSALAPALSVSPTTFLTPSVILENALPAPEASFVALAKKLPAPLITLDPIPE